MKHYRKFTLLMLLALLLVSVTPLSAQDDTECEDGFRSVEHFTGTTCIPENPERVVAFDPGVIEMFAAFEFAPVGSTALLEAFFVSTYVDVADSLTNLTEDLPDIGFPVNQEVLLEIEPDLIIWGFGGSFQPENINDIAPVVVINPDLSWQENLLFVGDILNKTQIAEALIDDYEMRVETLQELLEGQENLEVSVVLVSAQEGAPYFIQLPGSFAHDILTDVGLQIPEAQYEFSDRGGIAIGMERLDLLDGDVILLFNASPDPEAYIELQENLDILRADPLFNTLNAAQNDQVYLSFPVVRYRLRGLAKH
ncbi:MAG: iron-siderophore ABC transporter substrate-binding protein [Chloroflexota bacterium]